MAQSFTPAVKGVLKDHKCVYVRQAKGDHELWASPINGRRFIVDGNIKSRFLANAVMKQAGIKYHFEEENLLGRICASFLAAYQAPAMRPHSPSFLPSSEA